MKGLKLTRRPGESIQVGPDIRVTVVSVRGRHVTIATEAPEDVRILRGELYEEEQRESESGRNTGDRRGGSEDGEPDRSGDTG